MQRWRCGAILRPACRPPMPTVCLRLLVPDARREPLVAELSDLGFDAFEETDDALLAYAPARAWDDAAREHVAAWLDALGAPPAEAEVLAEQNWNATWEATIQPLAVGAFVVAPTWAELPELAGRHLLRIDPKMAFGTGYHETTRIVLRLLPEAVAAMPAGAPAVLDVGTGTGVLALGALRLRPDATALGVDIDPWSATNATENAGLNDAADRFEVREGSLDVVPEGGFGLVVANIIRSILAPMLPALVAKRAPGAPLVLSGLLTTERDGAVATLAGLGLALRAEATENEWWGGTFSDAGTRADGVGSSGSAPTP